MYKKNILVTGANGYLGSALVAYLKNKNRSYRVLTLDVGLFNECTLHKEKNKQAVNKDVRDISEADLEKIRNKRLLNQFREYQQVASTPKGKLKEVRVEALRVGFKNCYQEQDFKTIVMVGDKIPNNLLMEDEVLLQFYDIASSKV